jgi:Protein of unknown function (DUF2937)
MIRRLVSMFAGGVMAVGASQAPEYAQQYNQRLGGAVDELRTVVQEFDADARRNGLTRAEGLFRLENAPDRFTAERGTAQRRLIQRFDRLEAQKIAMDAPDVTSRVFAMVRSYDGQVGRGAMKDYKPALPLTLEGLFFALLGFVGGAGVAGALSLPFRRRPPRSVTPRTAP